LLISAAVGVTNDMELLVLKKTLLCLTNITKDNHLRN